MEKVLVKEKREFLLKSEVLFIRAGGQKNAYFCKDEEVQNEVLLEIKKVRTKN